MAIQLSNSQRSIELPSDLEWVDEFEWTAVRDDVKYTLTGALVIETSTAQAGRPITLKGGSNYAWLTRDQMNTLRQMMDDGENMTLTLEDDRTFTVRFVYDNNPVSGTPIFPKHDYFSDVTIKLIEV